MLRLAGEIGTVREGTATGGATTTLTDASKSLGTDVFKLGTLFFLDGTYEGTSVVVTSNTDTQFTFSALDDAVEVGTRYACLDKDIPRDVLMRAVNEALRDIAPYKQEDTVLETVADQEVYSLPAYVRNLLKVEIATATEEPYGYYESNHWDFMNGELRFAPGFAPDLDGYAIRLTYQEEHTDLVDESEDIPYNVNMDVLHWTAVLYCAKYGRRVLGDTDKVNWTEKASEASAMRFSHQRKQETIRRSPRHADW